MAKVKVNDDIETVEPKDIAQAAELYDIERSAAKIATTKQDKYKEHIYVFLTKEEAKAGDIVDAGEFEVEYSVPAPRTKIVKEKLLALGVALELIELATEVSKEGPKLYVTRKKEGNK